MPHRSAPPLGLEITLLGRFSVRTTNSQEIRIVGRHAQALFTLARHDLQLRVEEGWLTALWHPAVAFLFPGRFLEEKWRHVLDALDQVASALERRPGAA